MQHITSLFHPSNRSNDSPGGSAGTSHARHVGTIFRVLLLLVALTALGAPTVARAAEGGSSQYLPGFAPPLAGLLPPPGQYFTFTTFLQSSSISRTVLSGRVEAGLTADIQLFFPQFTQITKARVLGSNWGYSVLLGFGNVDLNASATGPRGNTLSVSQGVFGMADSVFVPVMLGWNQGKWHEAFYLNVFAPTGDYSTSRVANTGKGIWSVDPAFALTYFDPKKGHEASVQVGFLFPFENHATNYQSGNEIDLDFRLAQYFKSGWSIALTGYVVDQYTGDSGSGARLGSFEEFGFGLGPQITYRVKNKKNPVDLSFKYLTDVSHTNRLGGDYLLFSGSYTF